MARRMGVFIIGDRKRFCLHAVSVRVRNWQYLWSSKCRIDFDMNGRQIWFHWYQKHIHSLSPYSNQLNTHRIVVTFGYVVPL